VTSLVFGGRDMQDLYIVTADNTRMPTAKGRSSRLARMCRD
jgi:sugar lactone lactonase YvrE